VRHICDAMSGGSRVADLARDRRGVQVRRKGRRPTSSVCLSQQMGRQPGAGVGASWARLRRAPPRPASDGFGLGCAAGGRALTRFSARTGSSLPLLGGRAGQNESDAAPGDRGDVRKLESSVTKREECVGSSGLGVSRRSSAVDADLRRIALSRHAPRGCLVLELGNAGREDEPSPPVRPWPAGVAVHSVYSLSSSLARPALSA
jgi:hypothetical protein